MSSLSLLFVILITLCLDVDLFGFILGEDLYASWIQIFVFFSRFGKFSVTVSSHKFSAPFSHSSSGILIMRMLLCLTESLCFLRLFCLHSFFFFPLSFVQLGHFPLLYLPELINSSASSSLLFIPSSIFLSTRTEANRTVKGRSTKSQGVGLV